MMGRPDEGMDYNFKGVVREGLSENVTFQKVRQQSISGRGTTNAKAWDRSRPDVLKDKQKGHYGQSRWSEGGEPELQSDRT